MWRRLRTSPTVRSLLGRTMASYLRFVWRTNRVVMEPADLYELADAQLPMILTFWHGQHFLTPFLVKPHHRAKVMISRSSDADVNAIAAQALGIGTIRGSGAAGRDFRVKGGFSATVEMIRSLEDGCNVAMTADVPKISRIAGLGVVTIAKHSGRPIYPVAIATSNRILAKSWDRAAIHLPFGKAAVVAGDGVLVAPDADTATLEAARQELQRQLDLITARAEELVGRKAPPPRPRVPAPAGSTDD
ncbi:lysophospholipid acyltransferase family protein [Ancylobacter sp. 6x-1]|uniref:Lysophospholipid acyltransferase family protein n=1 Tax=Ancylobacter crimeensis TaxID=2579147 RepID=A0ABT0DDE2_9HYPH|nr:lysophospholipid acyltransferase family protein [Ancylobacter crimeensis]MCK0197984.1 lysophospholipid acyltransferase family protein [Ancylobacter crimeensis]